MPDERFTDWRCDCGWQYHSPIALTHPPTHRCKPRIPKARPLKPVKDTP
jgi:hypothetical protein